MIVLAMLPLLTTYSFNSRRGEWLRVFGRHTSARVRPWPPAAAVASWLGVKPARLPWLFWEADVPEQVEIDYFFNDKDQDRFDIRSVIRALDRPEGVRSVRLSAKVIDGVPWLRTLREFEGLEELDLTYFDGLDDEGLAVVADMRGLRGIGFPHWRSEVTGRGIERLKALPRLERLSLVMFFYRFDRRGKAVRRELLAAIASLSALEEIYVAEHFDLLPDEVAFLEAARPDLKVVEVDFASLPTGRLPWKPESADR